MRTLILKIKGGFVCALRTYLISKGEAYTECGNKHFAETSQVTWGEPKCGACKKALKLTVEERRVVDRISEGD